jgi:CubicO group peptidase (beta-lactamase class C family)
MAHTPSGVSCMRSTGPFTFPSLLRCRALLAITALVLVVPACEGHTKAGVGDVGTVIEESVEEQLAPLSEADQVRAIVAAQDGEVVYQRYTGTTPGEFRDVASVTKSVMSTLVGIAVADGLLSLDDTLGETLPEYAGQMKPAVAKVTVRHLLTMTAEFPETSPGEHGVVADSRDWVATILADGTGAIETPVYSNTGPHLLGAVLTEATGMSPLDYARSKLFDPLGIDTRPAVESLNQKQYEAADFAWPTDPRGIHFGWGYMKLRPQDMLKLGQLYLDEGVWQGKRILPAAWVREATTRQVDGDRATSQLPDYGYLWWVGEMDQERAFAAIGSGGQLVTVVPDRRLVVVTSVALPIDPSQLSHSFGGVMPHVVESAVVSTFEPDD